MEVERDHDDCQNETSQDQIRPSLNATLTLTEDDRDSEIIETTSPVDEDDDDHEEDDDDYGYTNSSNGFTSSEELNDNSKDNRQQARFNNRTTSAKLPDKNNNNYYSKSLLPAGNESDSIERPELINSNVDNSNNINVKTTTTTTTTTTKSPLPNSNPISASCAANSRLISRKKRSHRRRYFNSAGNHHLNDNDHDGDIDRSNDDFDEDFECENSGNDCDFNANINDINLTHDNDDDDGDDDGEHDNNLIVNDRSTNNRSAKQQEKSTFLLRPRLQAQARNRQQDTTRGCYNQSSDHHHHHHHHHHRSPLKSSNIASSDRAVGNIGCNSKCNYLFDKKEGTFYNLKSSQHQQLTNNNRAQCNESTRLSYILKLYLFISKLLFYKTQQEDKYKSSNSELSTGEEEEGEVTEDTLYNTKDRQQQHRKVNFTLHKRRSNFLHDQVSDECESSLTMPSSSNRYQTLQGLDDIRPQRKISSRNRAQRLGGPSGYSRLNHNYHNLKPRQQQTFCQELRRFVLLVIIVAISCFILWKLYFMLSAEYNYLGTIESPSKLGHYKSYAVSTDAQPCAKVGKGLLAKGGSAVDAAVGTLICMGVVIPNSLGIGGGALITIYDAKKKEAVVIDGREIAPDYATENMFSDNPIAASRGPLSVGVPGELAASYKAHQMYGKLKWNELFEDSIEMAEKGEPMVEHLSYALKAKVHEQHIQADLAKLYTNPKTGKYYTEGELFIQTKLAETLRRIRDNGAGEFYNGTTGRLFIDDLQKLGGKMTMGNLARYEALVKKPLTFKLADDLNLNTVPLPGSGIVLSVILRVMRELGYYKNLEPGSTFEGASLYYHRLAEAFKFAYAQRAGLEDEPDDAVRMAKLIAKLSSDDFIKSVVNKIDNTTHNDNRYGGNEFFSEDHGTAHLSVVDGEGNAVAITSSVNLYFGSGLLSPSTGITYNDVMDDFVSPNITNKFGLAPSKYNHIKPGRRPLSSMAPSVFTDSQGNVRLVIGASGGAKITTAVATVSLRNCYLGEDIKTAIDGPRIHHQYLPNYVNYEMNFPRDLLDSLEARGHKIDPIRDRSSIIMAIAVDNKLDPNGTLTRHITANSDYRKGGTVDGF